MNRLLFGLGVVVFCLATLGRDQISVTSAPTETEGMEPKEYLQKFGYLPEVVGRASGTEEEDEEIFAEAVRNFQDMAGIEVTGSVNDETRQIMAMPRCGDKDEVGSGIESRSAATVAPKKNVTRKPTSFSKNKLTYAITKYTTDMSEAETRRQIERAFNLYHAVANISFKRVPSRPTDIDLSFGNYTIGAIAVATGPARGYVWFQDNLWWYSSQASNKSYGFNMEAVATHEIGHVLGMGHTNGKIRSIMHPFYTHSAKHYKVELSPYDVEQMQLRYGKR